jgi:hypothetical protein
MAQVELILDSISIIKISDEEYFSNYKNYISNSALNMLDPNKDGSIEKFLAGFKDSYSSSFELGTLKKY